MNEGTSSPAPDDHRAVVRLTPVGEEPRLRADALRNRLRLLDAAAKLAEEHGAMNLTMEAVANAAQVGKGTVFRRFGDRTGLLQALLDHSETQFQASFLEGPPPLGPGAPARERLLAFGPAALRHDSGHLDLYLAGEPKPARRHLLPSRRLRHTHLATLLRAAGAGGDTDLLAHTLLGYLDTVLVQHLLVHQGMPLERLENGWCDLVRRLLS